MNTQRGVTARFVLLCIGVWLHSADTLVTATIAPAIVDDLGGIAYINWTISLYEVGAIIAGAAAGVMCSIWGIKRVFVGATLLYGGGCLIAATAPNIGVLVSGRFMQGMGGGMMLTLCYVAIEAWFAPTLRSRMFAIVAAIWGGGSLLGPLIGGVFAGRHSWRGAFWAFAAQAVVLSGLAVLWLPAMAATPRSKASARDWPLLPLMVLSAATLVIAESGAMSDVSSGGVTAAVAGCLLGTALLYLAARLDRHAQVRLLPSQLLEFGHPVGAGLAMVFALSAATTGFWAYGPLIVKILFGTKPLVTGYILAGEAIAWSIATLAVASATAAADPWLIRCGAIGVAVGAAGFAIAVPTGSLAGMVGCGLLQGAGFGLCWPAIVDRTVRFADPSERSLASAAVSTVQRIGYAVGTAAAGIAANLSGLAEGVSAAAARTAGFWVFAAFVPVLAMGLLSAWRFTRTSLRIEPL
ncbi:MAG: MFS transporter [Pseudomonadota bacterium]|nr:MFS transporter [Pseudomonadota bacterium]